MFDFMNIMNKVKEAQAKIKEKQAELVHLTAEAEAGAGMVKVIVNGHRQMVDIAIDESLMTPDDKDMLKDLIVAAANKAYEKMDKIIKEEMQKATEGMMPNIPGMDMGSMFG
ncbi:MULTISPECIES: YbaB/EbfC family nucleoid-associated protein [Echinicola]|uniref:Nucleoid-associated protein Echvi_4060 n=2 Tax=Echinicola TaxID=390846 RepID=L0G402_ECHVK|nr:MULTISPECIES: YbaB/EbfC family nucleoid-associated protein [Echinicola]AGA80267.1 DNA-binding protein, YbaB/EbfC family [Echinicola vietnamensis DSM 17526]GGF42936.1 nucleoid-associated protein [Echinicola rosea]